MDQIKIGKFIKEKRKENKITQSELAERLNVTDRAVSKWENGKCMPDSGIIIELCNILNITINDLFCGEVIDMDNYNQSIEGNLLGMIRQKEENDKRLLYMEILIGFLCILPLFSSTLIVMFVPMKELLGGLIVGTSIIPLLVATPFALRIEQVAGYYVCKKCKYKYIPNYKSVFWAMRIGRTRYMKCPKCNKYSWNIKVTSGGHKND